MVDVFRQIVSPATWAGALLYAAVFLLGTWVAIRAIRHAANAVLSKDHEARIDRSAANFSVRIAQAAVFSVAEGADFNHLIGETQVTCGNLFDHLTRLRDSRSGDIVKEFVSRPLRATACCRRGLEHLSRLLTADLVGNVGAGLRVKEPPSTVMNAARTASCQGDLG
ncbi:hypothetical protein JW848_08660 [Candidatus Bipolaricaulota bacterium]|nr:hypothetical protein [Candidatus Bipolaricaulota bacterium]